MKNAKELLETLGGLIWFLYLMTREYETDGLCCLMQKGYHRFVLQTNAKVKGFDPAIRWLAQELKL